MARRGLARCSVSSEEPKKYMPDYGDPDQGPRPVGRDLVGEAVQCEPLEVLVGDRGVDRAVKQLKRKMATEGILRELKRRRHYMKPSVRRRKKAAEAARRRRKRLKQNEI